MDIACKMLGRLLGSISNLGAILGEGMQLLRLVDNNLFSEFALFCSRSDRGCPNLFVVCICSLNYLCR